MNIIPDSATAEKSAAWKLENAKYLKWLDDEKFLETELEDLRDELMAIPKGVKNMKWDALWAILPLAVFVIGLIYAALH